MKKIYLALTFVLIAFSANAQQPFITTWEVTADDLDIEIPTTGTGYNYTVDFGDGNVQNNVTGNISHTYASAGTYTVSITDTFPRICFGCDPFSENDYQLKTIEQWGDIQWLSMENAFKGCGLLDINASDTPDLSQVTNMSYMFSDAMYFNDSINNWDVSNVRDMSYMFANTYDFNQPLDNWDVSTVMNMQSMFEGAQSFNRPLNNWDVSNVTNMERMFNYALSFNQPINNWDVSNAVNMQSMFGQATSFNQPLNNWNVSSVTNMTKMFALAETFNQPINNWDVSNVASMDYMFLGPIAFNQALNNWDVSNVRDMSYMFLFAQDFNMPLDNWDVSNVIDMVGMFKNADSFNQPINDWDVSNVNVMFNMFLNATSFNQNLSNWQINTSALGSFLSGSGLSIDNYSGFLEHLTTLGFSNGNLGADGLEYCNQGTHNYLINNLGWIINGDSLSPHCNTITGAVLYDENNNGCNPNDPGINGFVVSINDGVYDFSTHVNNGNYEMAVAGTSFTVSIINYPNYYTVTPTTATVTFTTSDTEQQDFCVTANQSIEDLNITLLPVSEARPGFEADYQLVVQNMGTQTVANATVTLSFDDTKQSFVSANPSSTSTSTNQLTFGLVNLLPFEIRTIDITMQTFTPPTVNGGNILNFMATVMPVANDKTPVDNIFNFDQIVVNSFDPNDKQVLQGEEIFISQADDYLNYLIRFQNTGTASAINVRILDTLHPKLDYSTIKPVSTSHNYRVEITDGNHVEFIFENINLPHDAADEPGSHGFIAYKIKPKSDVAIGDIITGDAGIYFDFNAAIITNMVYTEIVPNLSIENFERNKIRLYPNPTNGTLNISSETELEKVELFSLTGNRLLLQESNVKKIDLHQFSEGIYFLKITGKNGAESVEKIVKK